MSHTVSIKAQVKCQTALAATCLRLGLRVKAIQSTNRRVEGFDGRWLLSASFVEPCAQLCAQVA